MQFRLTEGGGECRYILGVDDDGSLHGLLQVVLKNLNANEYFVDYLF